jgi:hypothetical protein|tara:strand:+ start:24 stop:422 length:399 start_codon:yes stop_codon:yes gene_type:complete
MATINTLKKKTIAQLKAIAVTHFHKFIRNRDHGSPCISCGKFSTLQAGHFYSAGHNPVSKFNEDNVHGQCVRCNLYLSANLIPYRQNLIEKIGQERFDKLELKVQISKRLGYKWDKFFLLEIIEKYKKLNRS